MGIPITLETKNETLMQISKVPLIGYLSIFMLTFGPAIVAGVVGHAVLPEVNEDFVLAAGFLLSAPWAFWLEKTGVKIRMLFMPAWVMSLLMTLVGVLLAYRIID